MSRPAGRQRARRDASCHGPLDGPRHPGRGADDGHSPRAPQRSRPGRSRRRTWSPGSADRLRRGLPVGHRPGEGVGQARHLRSPTPPTVWSRSRSPTPFCVERHRHELLSLLHGDVDLLFCNEDEANLLFGSTSLAQALDGIDRDGVAGRRHLRGCGFGGRHVRRARRNCRPSRSKRLSTPRAPVICTPQDSSTG